MEDAREARRKRLAERKTDRLAFITGQSRSPALSAPQDVSSRENIILSETPERYHSEDIVGNVLDNNNKQEPALKPDTIQFHKHEIESENPQVAANYVPREQKNEVASDVQNRTTKGEDISGKLFTTSMLQKPAGLDGPIAKNEGPKKISTIFTPRDIDQSVLATERLRLVVTLVFALLVVSSYRGLIFGSTLLSSIVSFRPLFLVLLTDVSIILGSAFLNHGINHRQEKDVKKAMEADGGRSNDLGRIFVIGKMLHRVLGAAFMDCSICAVIMICGLLPNACTRLPHFMVYEE